MKTNQNAELTVKPALFDRIFKPNIVTLPNGHTVEKPVSRTPFIAVLVIAIVFISARMTGFDFKTLIDRGYQLGYILSRIFHPDWSYFRGFWVEADHANTIKLFNALLDTIKMSIMGSMIGATLALPIAVLSSTNINRNKVVVWALRIVLMIIRTLPTLIIAKFASLIFGLGTYAGTVAIIVFTFGIVAKMMYESIETIDMGAFEATESFGANKFQSFWSACMPQILPTYLSYCLYSLEMNIRAAAILGYVGAGGLGILINEVIGWRDYESLGAILLALFVVVFIIENTSEYLRKKLS
ncbi:MAG: phosphonate ABC transporter, permease protein PhnE [Clostridia bacterium]|nr:phosphonate ABC transporter, permease protein PhnE [Clostridia bacterium]